LTRYLKKLGFDFAAPGSPSVWGQNASIILATMPRQIPLPPPEKLPPSVSDLENGTPVGSMKQI
jgi:hypothetical protein